MRISKIPLLVCVVFCALSSAMPTSQQQNWNNPRCKKTQTVSKNGDRRMLYRCPEGVNDQHAPQVSREGNCTQIIGKKGEVNFKMLACSANNNGKK